MPKADLVFVGEKAINMDNIEFVDLNPDGKDAENNNVVIYFSGYENSIRLKGKEAEEFRIELEHRRLGEK